MSSVFNSVLQPDQIASTKADLAYYGTDAGHQYEANPSLILFPKTTAEVQACVKKAIAGKISLVPSGGRTGYSGGATATREEVVISLERMNKIVELSLADATITVQAGVTLEKVQQAAVDAGLYYPVDFTTRGSAQIGGTIATNAGGIRVIRYGMTREWVLGLQVVSAAGEILEINRKLYKNNSGYDLTQLFCGSEGTLGIITEATLKLTIPPKPRTLACLALANDEQIIPIMEAVRKANHTITLFEYMDAASMRKVLSHHKLPKPFQGDPQAALLLEVETPENDAAKNEFNEFLMGLLEKDLITDVITAETQQQIQNLMQLRELIGDVINKNHTVHKQDVSVPISSIPEFLKKLQDFFISFKTPYETAIFGHVGDGNLHINVINKPDQSKVEFFADCHLIDESIFKIISSFHGSISAEHGVGLSKKKYLPFCRSNEEIEMMRAIKRALDPLGILNPQKIIDT